MLSEQLSNVFVLFLDTNHVTYSSVVVRFHSLIKKCIVMFTLIKNILVCITFGCIRVCYCMYGFLHKTINV